MVAKVLQLKCSCNNYPWGKTGRDSIAATLCEKTSGTDFKLDEKKDYAEMWMGTYPELPSYVLETGEDLQKVIDANPELIGKNVIEKFGDKNLPFLPKVLSIAKALPLQVHPNKELSAKLHKKDPSQFTDPNHKPEIAVALSKFEAFVGWKPLSEITPLFALDPLKRYVEGGEKFDDQALKKVVLRMLTDSDESIKEVQEQLGKLDKKDFGEQMYIPELLPRLQEQYDITDPGNLVALLTMNYLILSPGDSIYIPADGIHAYLSGDIIECMARSNNVLNTGFCPRPDRNSASLFIETLTFAPHSKDAALLPIQNWSGSRNGKTRVYAPPMSEFNMLLTSIEGEGGDVVRKIGGPSVLIVTSGEGVLLAEGKEWELKEGYIFFIGEGVETEFVSKRGLDIYRAIVE